MGAPSWRRCVRTFEITRNKQLPNASMTIAQGKNSCWWAAVAEVMYNNLNAIGRKYSAN